MERIKDKLAGKEHQVEHESKDAYEQQGSDSRIGGMSF